MPRDEALGLRFADNPLRQVLPAAADVTVAEGNDRSAARLLGRPTPPNELMRWKLRLYCGHVIERAAHYTHKTLHAAFAGSTSPECGLDPATIIDGVAVGLKG